MSFSDARVKANAAGKPAKPAEPVSPAIQHAARQLLRSVSTIDDLHKYSRAAFADQRRARFIVVGEATPTATRDGAG